jgi:hypothetical protein
MTSYLAEFPVNRFFSPQFPSPDSPEASGEILFLNPVRVLNPDRIEKD